MNPGFTADRYWTLDAWRGVASLWVMWFHLTNTWLAAPAAVAPNWLRTGSMAGWFGVHLFFVISGYCVTARAARDLRRGFSVRAFFRDRLLRIYPVYWAALLLALALALAAHPFNHAAWRSADGRANGVFPHDVATALGNVSLLDAWFRHVPGYLVVAWSLTHEIFFYALMAAGIALGALSRRPEAPVAAS